MRPSVQLHGVSRRVLDGSGADCTLGLTTVRPSSHTQVNVYGRRETACRVFDV